MILNKREQEAKRILDEKIMDVALKRGLTYVEAKKIVVSGQSSLADFKFR